MQIEINGSDSGTLLVFQLDLPGEAVERFTVQAGTGEWPLKYALGATTLRNGFVDVVDIRDLEQMRLSQYLTEAHNASGDAFNADRNRLDALTGHLVILPAQAFDNTSQTLRIAPQLRLIGSYSEATGKSAGPKLGSASAKGLLAHGKSPQSANGSSPFFKFALAGVAVLIVLILAAVLL
jgi:hypothetical protein